MLMGPHFRIDVEHIGRDYIGGRAELPLLATLHVVWHRREPNIDVEADLMASVVGKHRPAARLRHVADQKTVPANLFRALGKPFDEANELRIAPVAVTRQPHDLPTRSGDRQRHSAGEAAVEIAADRSRRPRKWRRFAREQFLGRHRRRVRILQWRQRLGIERAGGRRVNQVLFLRSRRTRGSERIRTASRRAAVRISNSFSYGSLSHWWRGTRRRAPVSTNVRFCTTETSPWRTRESC